MKCKITRSSGFGDEMEFKKINSIDELLEFMKESEHSIILHDTFYLDDEGNNILNIEIYDDYRE